MTTTQTVRPHHLKIAGRDAEALQAYESVAARHPDESSPQLALAWQLIILRSYQQAADVLDQARQRFPQATDIPLILSRLLTTCPDDRVRNPVRGLQIAEEISHSRNDVSIRELLAVALLEAGSREEGLEQLKRLSADLRDSVSPAISDRVARALALAEAEQPIRELIPFHSEETSPEPTPENR